MLGSHEGRYYVLASQTTMSQEWFPRLWLSESLSVGQHHLAHSMNKGINADVSGTQDLLAELQAIYKKTLPRPATVLPSRQG